jgi:hypothetical protein
VGVRCEEKESRTRTEADTLRAVTDPSFSAALSCATSNKKAFDEKDKREGTGGRERGRERKKQCIVCVIKWRTSPIVKIRDSTEADK